MHTAVTDTRAKQVSENQTLFSLRDCRWGVVEGADVIQALVRAHASADGTPEQTEDPLAQTKQ